MSAPNGAARAGVVMGWTLLETSVGLFIALFALPLLTVGVVRIRRAG